MKLGKNFLLLQLLRNPSRMVSLSLHQWDTIIRQARLTRMLGFLACRAIDQGLVDQLPDPVRPHLFAENRLSLRQVRMVKWEVDRIAYALRHVNTPIVLLKGAAYCMLDLPFAKGRLYGDTDVLIRKSALEDAEAALKKNGWREKEEIDPLNRRYFRQWLHELPPMQHSERMTVIDVHHTILPLTDRLNVDPSKLLTSSRPLNKNKSDRVRTLSPADMVLHAATHFLRGGDFTVGLRNLFDLHGMVTHFSSSEPDFWSALMNRAIVLDLKRPCFYAMRYIQNYFHTKIPTDFSKTLQKWLPPRLNLEVMDRLMDRAILPRNVDTLDSMREMASFLLSHWPLPRFQAWLTPLFWTKRFSKN